MPSWRYIGQNLSTAVASGDLTLGYPTKDDVRTNALYAVTYSSADDLFVAVGNAGTVITSPDGTTWTTRTSGTANQLNAVTYSSANDLFVAVDASGIVITSPDGTTWTTRTSGTTNALSAVTYSSADDLFVAAGGGGVVLTSPDGTTWTCPVLKTGDLFVAMIAYRSNAAFSLPSGWSLVATQQSSGNTLTVTSTSIGSGLMAYCVYDAASPPGYTFTRTAGNVAYGRLAVYRAE
jgi:hypothetical protein